jgi:hypothetical protein
LKGNRHLALPVALAVIAAGCAIEGNRGIADPGNGQFESAALLNGESTGQIPTMTPAQFQAAYALLIAWMEETNRSYAPEARSAAALGFPRLARYFPAGVLASAKVVHLDTLPLPALASMGLGDFAQFLQGDLNGITYLDTIYIKTSQAADAALLFHEMIHVLQWRLLGPERFLALYAEGLARSGYRKSPLEDMAYRAQGRFKSSDETFDAEAFVRTELQAAWPGIELNEIARPSPSGK